ncbi:MAG: TrkA C-terminal domain-containing protein [Candidatus Nanopelagicales bacterium]
MIVDLLVEHTVVLFFVYLAVGSVFGALRIRGVLIGPAAVLFAALAISAFDERLALPPILGQIGLVLFAYCIGVDSGPSFFSSLRTGGRAVVLVTVTLLLAAGVAVVGGHLAGLNPDLVAGAYTGALTNTPALAAATEQLDSADPTVGYSVTYVFGVVAMIVAAGSALKGRTEPKVSAVPQPAPELTLASVRVETDGLPDLRHLITEYDDRIRFSRVRHNRQVAIATDAFTPVPGDIVSVIGPAAVVTEVAARLGHVSTLHLELDRKEFDFRRMAVSNREVAGRPLAELDLLGRFGATATRVRRGDIDLLATDDLIIHVGDRIRVTAPKSRMADVSEFFGDSEHGASGLNPLGLTLGIVIGLAIGLIEIPLPGGGVLSLGIAGGALVGGLILGRLHRTGPILWSVPYPTSNALGQFGMLAFLAYAGSSSGAALVEALKTDVGPRLFVVGVLITTTAAVMLRYLGPRSGGVSGPVLAGAIAGAQTQPAVLAFANDRTEADARVSLGYALVYPIAMIIKVLIAPLLGLIG